MQRIYPILGSERGNAFIEYFVFAVVILLATVAFYQQNLHNPGAGSRGAVETAFNQMVNKVLAP